MQPEPAPEPDDFPPPRPRPFRRKRLALSFSKALPGSAPGHLQSNPLSNPTQVMVTGFGPDGYIEQPCETAEEVERMLGAWPATWVHVSGLQNIGLIEQLGELFGLERLLLEDVLDISHRPKVEFYEQYVFTLLRGARHDGQFESDQVSLFLKRNAVIVFQERSGYGFEQVRERIRRGTGRIRACGTDYLYYALLDDIIDRYFPILDMFNTQLSQIEEEMMAEGSTDPGLVQRIHHAKSDLLLLHRTVWPVSDIVGMLMREETPLLTKPTRTFLRDCLDHSLQANELTQFYRDTSSGLLNTFLAYEGHKTNEIVKVLTMVSAVFIPLNLIAGIYGMNFHNMPELDWKYGYGMAVALMLGVAFFMLVFFWRKGWIESGWEEKK